MIYSKNQTTIKGLDELIKAFVKLPDDSIKVLEPATVVPAQEIRDKAKENVRKYNKYSNTKTLEKSIKVNKPSKRRKYKYQVYSKVYFGKGGAYGVPLELGHKIMRKKRQIGTVEEKPFLRPAADESKELVVKSIADSLNKALKEMGGKKWVMSFVL